MSSEETTISQPVRYVRSLSMGGAILEAVNIDNKAKFLIYNPVNRVWDEVPQLMVGDIPYFPVLDTPYDPFRYTKSDIIGLKTRIFPPILDHFGSVYKEIAKFISAPKKILEYTTIAILETYQQEKFNSLGYTFFTGPPDSGKTRMGEMVSHLAYRVLFTPDLNSANVYDFIGTEAGGTCTIVDDEAQHLNEDSEKRKIYRAGYRKGAKVRRIMDAGTSSRAARYYHTYCAKFFLGYYPPYDDAFMSRTVELPMTEGDPSEDEIADHDRARFSVIRNNLLLSRMSHFHHPIPQVDLPYRGRTKEIWKSKIVTSLGHKSETTMRGLADEYLKDKLTDIINTIEHYLTLTLLLTSGSTGKSVSFSEIWKTLHRVLNEELEPRAQSIESVILDRKLSRKVIAAMMKNVFAGKAENRGGVMWYHFSPEIVARMKVKYHVTDENVIVAREVCSHDDYDD